MAFKRLTPADVAPALGMSAQAVRVQMQNGKLPIGVVTEGKNGGHTYTIIPEMLYKATGVRMGGYEPPTGEIDYRKLVETFLEVISEKIRGD